MEALLARIGNSITDAQESVKSGSRNLLNKVELLTDETKKN